MNEPTQKINEGIQEIAIDRIQPSPRNPRQHFDAEALKELTASVKARGILTPIRVRPVNRHYEIIAGERRYRAAQAAGLVTVPAIIDTHVNEEQAFEDAVVENVQREQLTPLEEARSFKALLDGAGDGGRARAAHTIAERIGKSATYVWDLAKLADLIPEAAALLERGLITTRHAIPLARLTPPQQQKAIAPPKDQYAERHGGLFIPEAAGLDFDPDGPVTPAARRKGDPWAGLKAKTVREFEAWIADYVRFDPQQAAAAAPLDFGPVAEQVVAAGAQPGRGKRVISITHDSFVQPDAKTEERTYTAVSWNLADGRDKKSPTCDRSVLGVIVVGPEYGKTHQVCVHKDCEIHWAAEKKAREKRATAGKSTSASAEQKRQETEERKQKAEQARRDAERAAWSRAEPALRAAAFESVRKAKLPKILALLFKGVSKTDAAEMTRKLGAPKTPDVLLRHLAALELHDGLNNYRDRDRWTATAKAFGIDVAAVLKAQEKPAAENGTVKPGVCRECGCSDEEACEGGCGWADATETLCDRCAQKAKKPKAKKAKPAKKR
jgi:ParB/RepB/Spo0J family partition protein